MKLQENREYIYRLIKKCTSGLSGWLLLLPSLFLFYYIVWKPIGVGVFYSFFDLVGFTPSEFVGLKNYQQVINDTNFFVTLSNTVKYVVWSLVIGLPLPLICAIMLQEMIKGSQFIKISTYIPAVVPAIAVSLIWVNVYMEGPSGLLNMILYKFGIEPQQWLMNKNLTIPLIIISTTWSGFGSTMIYYLASIQSLNTGLYEAARIDGAGFLQRIRHIVIPHMMPIILLMTIKQVIGVFQTLDAPLVMTGGGPNGASTTLALTGFNYAFRYNQTDKALALNVITFVILVGLTFVYFYTEKKLGE